MNVLKILVLAALVPAFVVAFDVQAQPPQSCEDRVRELAVYADALARARTRAELDGAKTIADLLRQRDELVKRVQVLEAEKVKGDK